MTFHETCTAGAGSLVLEFGILSRLVGDPVFEGVSRRAVDALLNFKSNTTGLLGKFAISTRVWSADNGPGFPLQNFEVQWTVSKKPYAGTLQQVQKFRCFQQI